MPAALYGIWMKPGMQASAKPSRSALFFPILTALRSAPIITNSKTPAAPSISSIKIITGYGAASKAFMFGMTATQTSSTFAMDPFGGWGVSRHRLSAMAILIIRLL
jgi:hypothetical protein